MKETIGITGGCGLIGSHIAKKLSNMDYNIEILDNMSAYPKKVYASNLTGIGDAKIIKGSIRDKDIVNRFVKNKKYIIHLASLADVGATILDPETNFNTDVLGSFNLLIASRKANVEKIVFAKINFGDSALRSAFLEFFLDLSFYLLKICKL